MSSSSNSFGEQAEIIGRIARKDLDRHVQPLITYVDSLPRSAEKAAAMSHLHSLIGGLAAICDEAADMLEQVNAGIRLDAEASGE